MISKYTKYTPLEIPKDSSAEFFVKALDYRMKKEDAGVAELQSYADEVSNIDILKASDKAYFDEKYKTLTEQVTQLSGLDFTNPSSINRAKQTLSTIKDDPRIINALKSTQNARKVISQWDKVQTDPRLKNQYNSINHSEDLAMLQDYINGDDKASFNLQGASLYDGFHENLLKDVMKIEATQQDYDTGDGDFQKTVIKARSREAINSLAKDKINSSDQLRIEFNHALRQRPELINTTKGNIESFINRAKQELVKVQTDAKTLPENSASKVQLLKNAQELINAISSKEALLTADPKEAAWEIYKETVAQRMVTIGGQQSVSYQLDAVDQARFSRDQKVKEFAWNQEQDNIGNMFKQKELDQDFAIAQAKNQKDLADSMGFGETSQGQFAMDEYKAIPEGSEYSVAKTKLNDTYKTQIAMTHDLLKDLHNSISPVEFAKIQQTMKARGLDLDKLNLEKNSSLFFPKNLQALDTVVRGVLENSGNVNTPLYQQLSQKLGGVLEQNQLRILEAARIRQAEDAVRAEMGPAQSYTISRDIYGTSPAGPMLKAGTYNQGTYDSDFQQKVNQRLRVASDGQTVVYSHKSIPISGYANKETKEYIQFSNNVQTTLKSSDFVTSVDGSIMYPLNDAGISKTRGSKTGSKLDNVDWSKSEALRIDPLSKKIIVKLNDAEGKAIERGKEFAVPLNEAQTRSLATSIGYNYNQLVDVAETVDMNIDNQNYDVKAWEEISKSLMLTPNGKVGLPLEISLPFKVLSGSPGRRTIAFNNNGDWYTTAYFPTIKQWQQAVAETYKAHYAEQKRTNPEALDKTHKENAYKAAMKNLMKVSSKY